MKKKSNVKVRHHFNVFVKNFLLINIYRLILWLDKMAKKIEPDPRKLDFYGNPLNVKQIRKLMQLKNKSQR